MANLRKKFSLHKRMLFNIHARYVGVQSKIHKLQYFFWECTSKCNLACKHCGSDCKIEDNCPNMPADDFLNVCKDVAKNYDASKVMVVVTGGEPLMRSDLEYCGNELKKMGFPWGMVSNGFAMTESRFRSLRNAGLKSVTVSLDGLKENHDWMRGVDGSFERAVNAIKMLASEPNMVYDVVTCVNKRNILELDEVKKLLIEIGVKQWRLFIIDPIGRAAKNDELMLDNEQFKYVYDFIYKTRSEGSIVASAGCDGFLGDYEGQVRNGFFFCRAGVNVASVLANGDIGACPNINRGFVQGNIYKDNFIDIWNNKFEHYRNRKVFKTGICAKCDLWKWCRGEGMHLREPNAENPLQCSFNKIFSQNV